MTKTVRSQDLLHSYNKKDHVILVKGGVQISTEQNRQPRKQPKISSPDLRFKKKKPHSMEKKKSCLNKFSQKNCLPFLKTVSKLYQLVLCEEVLQLDLCIGSSICSLSSLLVKLLLSVGSVVVFLVTLKFLIICDFSF